MSKNAWHIFIQIKNNSDLYTNNMIIQFKFNGLYFIQPIFFFCTANGRIFALVIVYIFFSLAYALTRKFKSWKSWLTWAI